MPLYKYKAKNINKKSKTFQSEVTGFINAKTQERASILVSKKQLIIREITEIDSGFNKLDKLKGITLNDCIIFSRQLQTLLEAGVDLLESIHTTSKVSDSALLRHELRKCFIHVKEGNPTSSHFIDNKKFPRIIGTMLTVGETTGDIATSCKLLADHFEFQQDNERKVKEAINKPKQLLSMIIVIVTLMMIFVIPTLLKGFTGEVPLPTKIVMWVSNALTNEWHLILLCIFNCWVMIRYWLSKGGDITWDKHKHKIPVLGPIWQKYEMIVFSRTCSMMFKAGVPFSNTLPTSAETSGNKYNELQIKVMVEAIEAGQTISNSAVKANIFPLIVETMITVGEKTGSIDTTLLSVATYYKREIDFDLKMMNERLQPYILYFCGGLVLLIVLAIYLPILEGLVGLL